MEKKFKVLHFIGSVYKILGIIVAVAAIIGALGFCVVSLIGGTALQTMANQLNNDAPMMRGLGGAVGGIIGALFVILNGGLLAVGLYAIGEGIYLMLDIEMNTRAMVALMQQKNI
jgi:hypothetical protein